MNTASSGPQSQIEQLDQAKLNESAETVVDYILTDLIFREIESKLPSVVDQNVRTGIQAHRAKDISDQYLYTLPNVNSKEVGEFIHTQVEAAVATVSLEGVTTFDEAFEAFNNVIDDDKVVEALVARVLELQAEQAADAETQKALAESEVNTAMGISTEMMEGFFATNTDAQQEELPTIEIEDPEGDQLIEAAMAALDDAATSAAAEDEEHTAAATPASPEEAPELDLLSAKLIEILGEDVDQKSARELTPDEIRDLRNILWIDMRVSANQLDLALFILIEHIAYNVQKMERASGGNYFQQTNISGEQVSRLLRAITYPGNPNYPKEVSSTDEINNLQHGETTTILAAAVGEIIENINYRHETKLVTLIKNVTNDAVDGLERAGFKLASKTDNETPTPLSPEELSALKDVDSGFDSTNRAKAPTELQESPESPNTPNAIMKYVAVLLIGVLAGGALAGRAMQEGEPGTKVEETYPLTHEGDLKLIGDIVKAAADRGVVTESFQVTGSKASAILQPSPAKYPINFKAITPRQIERLTQTATYSICVVKEAPAGKVVDPEAGLTMTCTPVNVGTAKEIHQAQQSKK